MRDPVTLDIVVKLLFCGRDGPERGFRFALSLNALYFNLDSLFKPLNAAAL